MMISSSLVNKRMIYDQEFEIVASILPGPFPAIQHETLKSWELAWRQGYEIVPCDKSVVDEHLFSHHNYRMKECTSSEFGTLSIAIFCHSNR